VGSLYAMGLGLGAAALGARTPHAYALGAAPAPASRAFDPLFRQAGDAGIPPEFLRALGQAESAMNPLAGNGGLFQIQPAALADWNQRHGLAGNLADPAVNTAIAVELLGHIVGTYRGHPSIGAPDWNDRRYVELVIAGWNAGYSNAAGVGYVAGKLDAAGGGRLDADAVYLTAGHSGDAQISRHLANPAKRAYWRRVADAYFAERARPAAPAPVATRTPRAPTSYGDGPGPALVALTGSGILLAAIATGRKRPRRAA